MVFVNTVADIVHSSVDRYCGAANKNIGDAFLMVWKFSNAKDAGRDTFLDLEKKIGGKNFTCQTQADMAVLGYLKIIIRINKDNRILKYNKNEMIKKRIINNNFKVNMGFGLHLGWAIEGAVGSSFKIDASYLSPNVNMAARLEAATRQYGVTILISGQLYDYLSEGVKKICRHIDTVEVKGSKVPIRLYTIDLNLDMKPSKRPIVVNEDLHQRLDLYSNKKKQLLDEVDENGDVSHVIFTKRSFKEILRNKRPKKFYKNFREGVNFYINGEWGKASKLLTECLSLVGNDKPTKVLLEFLKEYNYSAPADWKGFRSLTSK